MLTSVKTLDLSEDLISDRFWDVYDPVSQPLDIMANHNVVTTASLDNSEFHVKLHSTLIPSTLSPVPSCPEFVCLCAQYYSVSEQVIMDLQRNQIICKLNPETLSQTLKYSADFISTSISFNEAEISQIYKKASTQDKERMYQKVLLEPVVDLAVPFSSKLCLPVIVSAVTLLSQVLGSDSSSEVTEAMLGILLYLDRPGTLPIRFDEYIAKEMSFQLSNFSKMRHFRFQAYLYALVIDTNRQALCIIDPVTFNTWPPSSPFYHSWSYAKFIDLIILNLFRLFNPNISRISNEQKQMLNPDLTGDWFLAKNFSLIRVFGFTGSPYVLPIFLTDSVFALELMRQRISADIEHFTKPSLKKSSWIKYPLTVGNFVLKKEAALSIIEQVLKQFNFPQALPVNYDPKHVISQRRQECSRGLFQHTETEAWMGQANSLVYDQIWMTEPLKQIVENRELINFSQPNTAEDKMEKKPTNKRSQPEDTEMNTKEAETSKKQKTTIDTEIIDLDMIKELVISSTVVEEKLPQTEVESSTANSEKSNKLPPIPVLEYKRYSYAAEAKD